ncbi:MAG: hypothetical protein U9N59_05240 [Campylobacterota bacterium]|nr:hypothetical protein [Campylobacterota bacterium]
MKNRISQPFESIQDTVKIIFNETIKIIKESERLNKKAIKSLRKKTDKKLVTLKNNGYFFDQVPSMFNQPELTTLFLYESLNLLKTFNITTVNIIYLEFLDLNILFKDKDFLIFLKYIMLADEIYNLKKEDSSFDTQTEYLSNLKRFFSDIRSIFLSYCLVKEKSLTKLKIQNITSFVMNNSKIIGLPELSKKQISIFNQIKTGVKYEKIKNDSVNMNITYSKPKRFNLLEKVKRSIKIKYISNQEYKHRFHKSPIEHERKGHYRYYKSGKKVWVNQTIINIGKVA